MLSRRAFAHPGSADPRLPRPARTVPFRDAEEVWFWTMASLQARHAGAQRPGGGTPRPCDPDDVILCLDSLYRRKRIELAHARVLRAWGERGERPQPWNPGERRAARLWDEAMALLDWPLRIRGIIVERSDSRKIVVDSLVAGG